MGPFFCCDICICCLKLHQADYQVEEGFLFFLFNLDLVGEHSAPIYFSICAVYRSLGRREYFGVSNVALVQYDILLPDQCYPSVALSMADPMNYSSCVMACMNAADCTAFNLNGDACQLVMDTTGGVTAQVGCSATTLSNCALW